MTPPLCNSAHGADEFGGVVVVVVGLGNTED